MRSKQRNSVRTSSIAEQTNAVISRHRKMKKRHRKTSILAVAVLLFSLYAMILPTITMDRQDNSAKLLSATNDSYVGFSKMQSDRTVDFANGADTGGVRKYYVVPNPTYEQYKNYGTYAAQQQMISQAEVAYCFNHYLTGPDHSFTEPAVYYTEAQSVSPTQLYSASSYHRRYTYTNRQTLYNKVMAMAINGYPNDYSGIGQKYGLTDDEFRYITQYAIWYYTDSISLRFTTYYYTTPVLYAYADDTNTWLTKDNAGNRQYHSYSNPKVKSAYEELISSTLNTGAVNASHINLYMNTTGGFQHLLTVGKEAPTPPQPNEAPTSSELKAQITAKKTIDGGQTDIGSNRFQFRLTGNGQDVTVENDENGNIMFPEISYTEPGTYTYTIEEETDERDGVSFDFDKSKKTVTVTITSQAMQTFDPNTVYYAFEELNYDDFEYYYYVDTVPGGKGIIMYCTYQGVSGPQYELNEHPVLYQTYRVVLNPTVSEITANHWVMNNIYGNDLVDNLRKLFYYLETDDAKNIPNGDKQSLVWSATGKTSSISSISVNGKPANSNVTTVLNYIYETVSPPSSYNLAFFVPTGSQAINHPQPLATGYGALIDETVDEVVFNNTSKVQNSLKIGKTVTGTAGETDREFNFKISLMDNNRGTLSGTYTVIPNAIEGVEKPSITSITFTSGIATVALKHGQNITITGLTGGFYYAVTETEMDQDGYTSTLTQDLNNNLSSSGATGAVDVEFKNHKDAPPPSTTTYEAEIKATKTLDGVAPADGQFIFILRDADGNEVSRKTNDANGDIVFPLTFTEPGTYTYTIEEFNDHQQNIVYDTEVITATVTVGNETLQTIMNGSSFVGSKVNSDLYITVNDTTRLDVYCINADERDPRGNYDKVLNPTTSQLASQVTANYCGTALAENMRKLLYYFDTHSYTDTVNNRTLSKSFRQSLVWSLTGYSMMQDPVYTTPLNTILAESNPPDNYTVVLFAPLKADQLQEGQQVGHQPVAVGYLPDTNVVYSKRTAMAGSTGQITETEEVLEFENYHEYVLPETGGIGTIGYAIGGILLISVALLLMYKTRHGRKKEGKC